jgi:hypothetical protein
LEVVTTQLRVDETALRHPRHLGTGRRADARPQGRRDVRRVQRLRRRLVERARRARHLSPGRPAPLEAGAAGGPALAAAPELDGPGRQRCAQHRPDEPGHSGRARPHVSARHPPPVPYDLPLRRRLLRAAAHRQLRRDAVRHQPLDGLRRRLRGHLRGARHDARAPGTAARAGGDRRGPAAPVRGPRRRGAPDADRLQPGPARSGTASRRSTSRWSRASPSN